MTCNSTHKRHFAFTVPLERPYVAMSTIIGIQTHHRKRFYKLIYHATTSFNFHRSLFTCEDETFSRSEGEMQTNQSCSTVRECIKLDLLLTVKQLFCSHLPQSKGDSWRLHFVPDAHPRNDTLNEHLSTEQFIRLWGQRTYLLTAFSACFARIVFGQFNIVCISEHDKKYIFCAVLWNKHVPLWPLWCSLLLAPLCHSSIHIADRWRLPHSCLFFFLCLTHKSLQTAILIIFFLNIVVYFPLPKTF